MDTMPDRLTTQFARLSPAIPYLLALFFGLWALRGVGSGHVINTDAARHAMNGVFIRDLILENGFTDLVAYGQSYYSRLPALSLPYHPPVFPMFEAIFFLVLGVNILAARLAIATATAVSFVLLYRLIVATHHSQMLAALTTVTFFSMRLSQTLSQEVFLEFPMMAFILGALHCLKCLDEKYPFKHGLAFAVLAGTAVWTKQHAVFLGSVPFLYVAVSGRWRLLLQKTIWLSSVVFGGLVLAWVGLCVWFFDGSGIHHTSLSYPDEAGVVFLNNLEYYAHAFDRNLGTLPAILLGVAFLVCLFMARRQENGFAQNHLYLAWILAVSILLAVLGDYTSRYLFLLYAPLFLTGYFVLHRGCSFFLSGTKVWYIPVAIAAVYFAGGLRAPSSFMHGPAEVASHVVAADSSRVLYCGQTDGSFIFALRSLDPQRQTMVIRGGKLPDATFLTDNMEQFAHDYGIHHIILEKTKVNRGWRHTKEPSPWLNLLQSIPPSMVLEHTIPLKSSQRDFNGDLLMYRFTNPSPQPKDTLNAPSRLIHGSIILGY